MGVVNVFQSLCIIAVGFIIGHFIRRKVPQYPHREVYEMFRANPHYEGKPNAEGAIAIITGSTSGIGRRVSEELFRYGANVVIASRHSGKAQETIDDIVAANPGSRGNLVYAELDTSDLDSVRRFASWVGNSYDKVDYLVNNAGVHYFGMQHSPITNTSVPTVSKQGYDLCFATNYLGHFLLTHLLLPKLSGRVVNIASTAHFQADGTALNPALGDDGRTPNAARGDLASFKHRVQAYAASKLAGVLHAVELQKRLVDYGVPHLKILAVCPGWVQTGLHGQSLSPLTLALGWLGFKPQEGVLSTMAALFDANLQGGEFLSNHILPGSGYPWLNSALARLTELGVRDPVVLVLRLFGLATQSQSYGHHTHRPSPECHDEQLTAAFYDWTLEELKRKGYINN